MNTISLRFASITVVVSLVILSAIGAINYAYLKDELLQEATKKSKLIEANSVYKIQTTIQRTKIISEHVKEYLIYHNFEKKSIEKILKKSLQDNKDFYGMAMAFEPNKIYKDPYSPYYYKHNSKIVYVDLALSKNYNYLKKSWYQQPKINKKPTWSEPYFDEGGGNVLMATYGNPIIQNNKFIGIVTIDFSLQKLQDIISSIHVLKTGYAFLISQEHEILVDPHNNGIMTRYNKKIKRYNHMIKENNRWIYYTHIKSTDMILGIVFPENELFESLNKISVLLVILGLIGSSLLVISIVFISRKITKPLKDVTQLTHQISLGDFDKKLQLPKTNDEVYDLACSINRMQDAIKQYIKNLKDATIKQQKIESELEIAKEIQTNMLPKIFHHDDNISIEAILKPAKAVGGDFYDFFQIDDEHICFVIADVSGKGIPAAMFMAVSISYIRAYSKNTTNPSEIVNKVNNTISLNNDANLFVTLFLGVLNTKNNELTYVNAGHNPPYLISKNTLKTLPSSGNIVVGAFEDMKFSSNSLKLKEGEKIFLYTDGVNEAFSKENEPFGIDRLENALLKYEHNSNINLLKKLEELLKDFTKGVEQSDDITMLLISI